MPSKEYINFIVLLLFKYRTKHLWVIIISSLLVAIVGSFFFVSSSIKQEMLLNLDLQADFVVQKYRAGKVEDMPLSWIEGFKEIQGIQFVRPRIYGMHFYDPQETYFLIVGVDFSDENARSDFQTSFADIDIQEFLEKDKMIIGSGVKKLFDFYEYKDYYTFRPPDRSMQKVYFHSEFAKSSQLFTNDMIIMEINVAKKILGTQVNYCSDIAIDIEKGADIQEIQNALAISHFDMRIISKESMQQHYENIFNYKGGVFLALYTFSFITFLLILYQRYSNITHSDAKEIALLRVMGWKISDVMYLKLMENFLIAIVSYMLGIILAYFYVFVFKAPLLQEIFLGFHNLSHSSSFTPSVDISSLILSFFLFVMPFMLVILVPVWKISISEPFEVMR